MNFDEIWTFVEEKLNPVPTYIKHILHVCGYNNGISIATIEDEDIGYFVSEVRNGNVSKYFESLSRERDVLEGSTKTVQNFEFSRGHLKYLKYVVQFLKNYVEENGIDCFTKKQPQENYGIKRRIQETASSSRKRMKPETSENDEGIKKQEGILLGKTIMSVITHTSEIYVKVSVK